MGNICRSPTAEGVFRRLVGDAGLSGDFYIDSAGTHAYYHEGSPPDQRAAAVAASRGFDLEGIRSRMVGPEDFDIFDWIIAMDRNNLTELQRIKPPESKARVQLLLRFATGRREEEVPDPYYGGAQGFERVLDLVEVGSRGLLSTIRARHRL